MVLLAGLLFLLVLIRIWLHTETSHTGGAIPTGRSWSPSLFESCAQEFHWCFLRAAVWDFLLIFASTSLSPHYWAVWIGAAISLPGIHIQARSSLGPALDYSDPLGNLEPFPRYAKLLAVLLSSLGNQGYPSVEPAFPARGLVNWICR